MHEAAHAQLGAAGRIASYPSQASGETAAHTCHHLAAFPSYRLRMPRKPTDAQGDEIPDVCDKCGQKIDRNSHASFAHHKTPKQLPYMGEKKRVDWVAA
jgi:hypothetical protein